MQMYLYIHIPTHIHMCIYIYIYYCNMLCYYDILYNATNNVISTLLLLVVRSLEASSPGR